MNRVERPTLLVFTLGPGREQARRRLLQGTASDLEREFHERCLGEVLDVGRETGCALRLSTPAGKRLADDAEVDDQAQGSFARRLLAAIRTAGQRSPGPLVVVGTDTPEIAADLRVAIAAVGEDPDEVIIGPAADGGVYLLASAQPILRELAQVRWQSRQALSSLLAALAESGRPVRLLPVLADIDSRADLERWASTHRAGAVIWAWLIGAFRRALAELAGVVPGQIGLVPAPHWREVSFGRAPPR